MNSPARSRRSAITAVAAAAALAVPLIAAPHAAADSSKPPKYPFASYVDVSVATVWTKSSSPRPVDAKAIGNPVDIPGWINDMTPDQQGELTSRNLTQTQALYGQKVWVLKQQGDWSEVAVPDQPTPKNDLGYPGWVPNIQLTTSDSYGLTQASHPFVLLNAGIADWLYDDAALTSKNLELSVNTRLPLLASTASAYEVATPDRGAKWVSRSSGTVYGSDAEIPTPTGDDLVATAKTFLGQHYIWAGRSAWGFDCSGFTSTIYELHGIVIPRDAGPQALDGGAVRVAKDDLQAGDLLFYAPPGTNSIYHVAMYIGDGQMIEAYDHLTPVRVTPVRFNSDYWGAVRYLNT